MQIQGSVLVFPRLCLLWHVKALEVRPACPRRRRRRRAPTDPRPGQDVGDDSLAALTVYHPRPGAPTLPLPPPPLSPLRVRRRALHPGRGREHAGAAARHPGLLPPARHQRGGHEPGARPLPPEPCAGSLSHVLGTAQRRGHVQLHGAGSAPPPLPGRVRCKHRACLQRGDRRLRASPTQRLTSADKLAFLASIRRREARKKTSAECGSTATADADRGASSGGNSEPWQPAKAETTTQCCSE